MRIRVLSIAAWLIAAASCGGGVTVTDAAPEATEVTNAGGRAAGGRYTLDFQVGHAHDQGKSSGGTVKLKAGAAVTR
jgi:hypothetical protein